MVAFDMGFEKKANFASFGLSSYLTKKQPVRNTYKIAHNISLLLYFGGLPPFLYDTRKYFSISAHSLSLEYALLISNLLLRFCIIIIFYRFLDTLLVLWLELERQCNAITNKIKFLLY